MDRTTVTTVRIVAALAASLLIVGVGPAAAQTQIAYSNDFGQGAGGGATAGGVTATWSHGAIGVAPNGRYGPFLGQFSGHRVTLTLTGLPAHSSVIVSFKLFIIRGWDGNDNKPQFGPDFWEFGVGGGPGLLRTTFTNVVGLRQSYPGQYPSAFPAHTGALEVNTLGYVGDFGDSVYQIGRSFSHRGSSLTLYFAGSFPAEPEHWGIDDVTVAVVRR